MKEHLPKTTFLILILLSLSATGIAQSHAACESYKEGWFEYAMDGDMNTNDVVIYRTGNYQIEYEVKIDQYAVGHIRWTSDCDYILNIKKSTLGGGGGSLIGKDVFVDLTGGDAEGYDYTVEVFGKKLPSRIIFLKSEKSKAQLKKVKKAMNKFIKADKKKK
ncbi:MAG: hypothetical protein H6581_14225 [Bacteroidia bacterium]|nr:hypothetical protein [Bacteroidia bacterium]